MTEAKFLWVQKQDMGPRPRGAHAAAFDEARARVIAFGGEASGQFLDDTWAWDGVLWTQVADTGPSARSLASMVFTSNAAGILLFGGRRGAALFGDTWRWTDAGWLQIDDSGPSPRAGHALAYDSARQRVILFGGDVGTRVVGDTWEWDGEHWTQVEDTGPAPRSGHSVSFDRSAGRVILFGGSADDGTGLADTWAWDGSTWTQVADMGPPPRTGAAMAYTGRGTILFGGAAAASLTEADQQALGDTWVWRDGSWIQIQDMGPRTRWRHTLVFAPSGRLTLFGGFSATAAEPLGDTWEHAGDPVYAEPPLWISPEIMLRVIPESPRLVSPGDSFAIRFSLEPAPDPNLVVLMQLTLVAPDGSRSSSSAGLTFPDSVVIDTTQPYTEVIVSRGSESMEAGPYAIELSLALPGEEGAAVLASFQIG